jgi:hypothetical protein
LRKHLMREVNLEMGQVRLRGGATSYADAAETCKRLWRRAKIPLATLAKRAGNKVWARGNNGTRIDMENGPQQGSLSIRHGLSWCASLWFKG